MTSSSWPGTVAGGVLFVCHYDTVWRRARSLGLPVLDGLGGMPRQVALVTGILSGAPRAADYPA